VHIPAYAELRCVSNFTFLRGASQPEELVERAKQLGYSALAIADECSLAGVVRAHVAAKEHELKLLIGAQFQVDWGIATSSSTTPFVLTTLACNLHGYGNLCQFITKLRRSSEKGTYHLDIADIAGAELSDCVVLMSPQRMSEPEQLQTVARWLLDNFIGRCWLGVEQIRVLDDEMWLHRLRQVSGSTAIPLVAVGDAHFHVRSRKPLQDVLTATRVGKPLTECGLDLQPNAERHLRTRLRLAQTFPEDLLAETLVVAARCVFTLEELRYQYPDEVVPARHTSTSYLRQITYEGAGRRWPQGMPAKVQLQIEHELELIKDLKYEHYFLTVRDGLQVACRVLPRGPPQCQAGTGAANSGNRREPMQSTLRYPLRTSCKENAMSLRASDVVPISEARARLTELAEDVVGHGTEKLLTKNGASYVALVDARKLDYYHALEAEHAGLVLVQGALEGLEDLAAGRVLDEAELDRTLAVAPARPRKKA
jgi:DNA polymerase III alpha subunit